MSAAGMRTLAVAKRSANADDSYSVADEMNLVFVGFLCFADKPLESARETLKRLASDGVEVKILTGDNELVAASAFSPFPLFPFFPFFPFFTFPL